jgi:hypothetical protein
MDEGAKAAPLHQLTFSCGKPGQRSPDIAPPVAGLLFAALALRPNYGGSRRLNRHEVR